MFTPPPRAATVRLTADRVVHNPASLRFGAPLSGVMNNTGISIRRATEENLTPANSNRAIAHMTLGNPVPSSAYREGLVSIGDRIDFKVAHGIGGTKVGALSGPRRLRTPRN